MLNWNKIGNLVADYRWEILHSTGVASPLTQRRSGLCGQMEPDFREARKWYTLAAESGNPQAQNATWSEVGARSMRSMRSLLPKFHV